MKTNLHLRHYLLVLSFLVSVGFAFSDEEENHPHAIQLYRFISTSLIAEDVSDVCSTRMQPRLCSVLFPSETGEYYLDPLGLESITQFHVFLIPD